MENYTLPFCDLLNNSNTEMQGVLKNLYQFYTASHFKTNYFRFVGHFQGYLK